MIRKRIYFLCALLAALAGCRGDEVAVPSETDRPGTGSGTGGMYLLNEGNMGSNKCTLDYYDFATGEYHRNIYAERNPTEVMELGDVGNDIAVYGSKLYIAVNCSHKVEVLDAATARKIAQIEIPNCRYLAFSGGNAYVSSYIGPVGADPTSPLGAVFSMDTVTLAVTGEVAVGYQPEEMAVAGDKLYVANSGGYRAPDYDNRITAVSLSDFRAEYSVETAINLHRLKADRYGNLWATSRGDNGSVPSSLIKLTQDVSGRMAVSRRYDVRCDNFAFRGDSLLYFGESGGKYEYGIIDVSTGSVKNQSFVSAEVSSAIRHPYGLAVNPADGNIFITDAANYVSSGRLYCLDGGGNPLWEAKTGDIPSAMAFTRNAVSEAPGAGQAPEDVGAYISRVYEYVPAPGQFVNEMPIYEEGDTEADMIRKCEEAVCGKAGGLVTLGAFGGYITFGFDHPVENVAGEPDFRLWGNTVWQSEEARGGSAEPGIVLVSYDANGNGLPDDEWYELAGSEYHSAATTHGYGITYRRDTPVRWSDSEGADGIVDENPFHTQSYWPLWLDGREMSFSGTRLAPNAVEQDGNYILYSYPWGYADNYPNSFASENSFDISRAVDSAGNGVYLPRIHFIRVMTGLNQMCGRLGESSTELSMGMDLHYQERLKRAAAR